jgi:hypothetical protein
LLQGKCGADEKKR